MSPFNALISDADGTLVDSVSLIRHGQHEAAITFLEHHGVPESDIPSYEEYEVLLNRLVGGNTRQTLERTVKALYEDRSHHLEGIDYEELDGYLDPIQDRIAPKHVKAFPGLASTLSMIGDAGIKLAIFTSGTPHHVVRNFGIALSDQLGDYASLYQDNSRDDQTKLTEFIQRLQEVFNIPVLTVVTADDIGERTKPDPLSVELALRRLDVSADNSIVLGDHSFDMQSGVNAGISRRVGITHGFDDAELLRNSGATDIITSLNELTRILQITS